jgi:hypothetical protein
MTSRLVITLNALALIAGLSLLSATVPAQDVIEKSGGKCPSGYRDGKGAYCYQSSSSFSSQKIVVKTRDKCPSGYRDGRGGYCYGNDYDSDVIPKSGDKCPSGYRNGKGHYCYK